MKLTVLDSGSRGNCYVLQNDTEALILEAGVKLSRVMKALDYNTFKVVGCLVTHEHGDHAKYMGDYLGRGLHIGTSQGTALSTGNHPRVVILEARKQYRMGNFRILPFDVRHDCREPLGFLIDHPETGSILFATDTYYLPYNFPGLSHILLECNYSREILDENYREGRIAKCVRDRVIASHMSLDTCIEALKANDLSAVRNIVLLHLSDNNSDAKHFAKEVKAATGRRVTVAKRGLEIELTKELFQHADHSFQQADV